MSKLAAVRQTLSGACSERGHIQVQIDYTKYFLQAIRSRFDEVNLETQSVY